MAVAPSGSPQDRPLTRAVVIVNPLSGHGRSGHQLRSHAALARDVLARHDIETHVHVTTDVGDARRVAHEAALDGVDLVVAWGGDGTVNEIASALVHTDTRLGIVPAGSGNGLACDLGLPFNPEAALNIAAEGADFSIDAGQVHDSLFFNIAGIGVDALIAARFAERGVRQRGPLGYLQLGVRELIRYRAATYTVAIDEERTTHRAMLVAIANGRQYGNKVCIAPGARLDDGLLELVVVEQLSIPAIAWRLPSLFRGTLKSGRGVSMRPVRHLLVSATSGPMAFHVDGEPRTGPSEIAVTIRPRAVTVRVAPSMRTRS